MSAPNPPVPPPNDAPKEPVLSRTGVVLVTQAVVYAAAVLGFSLDPVVTGIVVGLAGPAFLGVLARAAAWAPRSVAELVEDVRKQLVEGAEPPAGLGGASGTLSGPAGFSTSPGTGTTSASYEAPTTNLRYPENKTDS